MEMTTTHPSKEERLVADKAYMQLVKSLSEIQGETPEIEIEETGQKIKVPLSALKLLLQILSKMKEGRPFSLVPVAAEMTTQAAAEYLNCSRPHVVKLLEDGKIPFTKVGRHRRIRMEDLQVFRSKLKEVTKRHLVEMMEDAEEMNLYDS